MHFLPSVIFILVSLSSAFAQNYATIDAHARNAKAHRSHKEVEDLALSLSAPCKTEKEKVRAFYVWIADNIRYDISTFQNRKELDVEERVELQMPQQVIKRKKAVCMGYTNLMNDLCNAVGIKTVFVSGVTKNRAGRVSRSGHAWSLVRTDGEWGLIDATWGSGNVDIEEEKYEEAFKEEYFFTPPHIFIKNHFPDDPLFQLLPSPLTYEAFEKGEKPIEKAMPDYAHLGDSLNAFISMDTLFLHWACASRLLKIDPQSNLGLHHLGQYHYHKSIVYRNQLASSYDEVKTNPSAFNQNWCNKQNDAIKNYEKALKDGMDVLNKSTKNDRHSRKITVHKNHFTRTLAYVEREKGVLKKNCSQLQKK